MRLLTATVLKASTDPRPFSRTGRSRTSAVATATGMAPCAPPRPPLPLFCFESALVLPQPIMINARQMHTQVRPTKLVVKCFDICPLRGSLGNLKSYTDFDFSAIAGYRRGPIPLGMCRCELTAPTILFDGINGVYDTSFCK